MRFLDRETCEKLVEIGCVSKSTFYHIDSDCGTGSWKGIEQYFKYPEEADGVFTIVTHAFTLSDFLETEEYAIENCRKLWPNPFDDQRINMIAKDWVKIITERVREI